MLKCNRAASALLVLVGLCIVIGIIGCGSDDDSSEESSLFEEPARLISSTASGLGYSYPADWSSFDFTFNKPPRNVTSNVGNVTMWSDTIVRIEGPFDPGILTLKLSWDGGSKEFTYNIKAPTPPDVEPPKITNTTIDDGDRVINLRRLNEISISFNEAVSGSIRLQNEDGEDLGYQATYQATYSDPHRITLKPVADSKKLVHKMNYRLIGTVKDEAGNELEINITFSILSRWKITALLGEPVSHHWVSVDDWLSRRCLNARIRENEWTFYQNGGWKVVLSGACDNLPWEEEFLRKSKTYSRIGGYDFDQYESELYLFVDGLPCRNCVVRWLPNYDARYLVKRGEKEGQLKLIITGDASFEFKRLPFLNNSFTIEPL